MRALPYTLALVVCWLGAPPANAEDSFLVNPAVDFGKLPGGIAAVKSVPVTNKTREPRRLLFESSDCGCTTGTQSVVIPPGETGHLEFRLATGAGGIRLEKKAVYRVAGTDERLRFTISAVTTAPLLAPETVDLGKVSPGSQPQIEFRLTKDSGWELVSATGTCGITGQPAPEPSIEAGVVRVRLTVPAVSGRKPLATYSFRFKGSTEVVVTRQIMGEVVNPVFVETALFLGTVRRSHSLVAERKLDVRVDPASVKTVQLTDDDRKTGARLEIEPAAEASQRVTVRLYLPKDVPNGVRTYHARLVSAVVTGPGQTNADVKVPVSVLVLP